MRHHKWLYLLLGLMVAAVPLLSTPATQAQEPVTVTWGTLEVGVAEAGALEARITCPAANCGAVTISFHFDRDKIRLTNATPGPFLGDQVLISEQTLDNAQGLGRLSLAAMAAPPAGADSLLLTLGVGGLIPGSAAITVDAVEVKDLSGAPLAASASNTTINVFETGKIAFFSPPAVGWEVAFVSERDGNPEIYAASADGSAQRRLTDNPALDGAPAWSPDGSRLAFHSARDGNLELYVMDPNGDNVRRLTDNPASDTDPAWSPDGSRIAFVSDRDGNPELYVMNADGSSPQRLTTDPGVDTYPAWSPDGQEIAFSSSRGGAVEFYLMDTTGGNVRKMTSLFGANGWYPAWSPDSSLLSLTVERSGSADIYTMTRQAENITGLTQKPGELSLTDWSPDGQWLAFMNAPDGNQDVLVMDSQGLYLFRITDNPANDYDPDWRATTLPAPVAAQPCTVRTDRPNVDLRVGPGTNRGVFTSMPVNTDLTVIGQATDDQGGAWWEIDKTQIPGHEQVNSLWVAQGDVQASGGCSQVSLATPPPLIPGVTPTPPGQWQGCGSCETCGHPANECVVSPEGQCLWDPSTCAAVPPPGDGCAYLTRQSDSPIGTVTPPPPGITAPRSTNCGEGGYTPGTSITLSVPVSSGFQGWSGTCPISGTANSITFVITTSCTAIANYG